MGDTGGRRIPALDGLRGMAILLVLAGHAEIPGMGSAGGAGVGMFLALSGFLITGRLVDGQPLRAFYLRRAARLVPAMALMLAVMGTFWLTVRPGLAWEVVRGATWTENFATAVKGGGPFTHLWSLALEEQFYLVWPLLLLWRRPTARTVAIAGGVGMAAQVVTSAVVGWRVAYHLPVTSFGPLALGCAVAMSGRRARWWPVGVALVAAGALSGGLVPAVILGGVGGAVLVAGRDSLRLDWSPLSWLGQRSYGVYLWHLPMFALTAHRLAVIPAVLLVAAVSFRWVETPVLHVARRPRAVSPVLIGVSG